ncbi:NUDIX domain-containing protein [Kitasatospora purpeofusca]|uniref:NUDIX domain-containing protein n=1 Tax=Kitasatospora purpeofusca TaxID=67352 RepID=UPI002B1D3168|nr:NUDIX domain-containing protein [Kitasatospora purpeofusca]
MASRSNVGTVANWLLVRCSAATASGASCWGKSSSRLVRHAFWRHSNPVVETRKGAAITEETGVRVDVADLLQLGVWDQPGRDPRGRYVTVAYLAVVPNDTAATAGDDARTARWWPWNALPQQLAFDHAAILATALKGAPADSTA